MSEEIIYPESEGSAKKVTMELWKSRNGYLFVEEDLARKDGATHLPCKECNKPIKRERTRYPMLCDVCKAKLEEKNYQALEKKEWDGVTPICTYKGEVFFDAPCEVLDYCVENKCDPEDLLLVHCKPDYFFEIDPPEECYYDILHENSKIPEELKEAFENVNKVVHEVNKKYGPASWYPGNVAVEYDWHNAFGDVAAEF